MRALKEQFRSILAKYRNELRQLTAEWEARFGRIERSYLQEDVEQKLTNNAKDQESINKPQPNENSQHSHNEATDVSSPKLV